MSEALRLADLVEHDPLAYSDDAAAELRSLSAELAALKSAMGEPVGRLESDEFAGHVFIPQVPGDWSILGKYLYAIPKEKP